MQSLKVNLIIQINALQLITGQLDQCDILATCNIDRFEYFSFNLYLPQVRTILSNDLFTYTTLDYDFLSDKSQFDIDIIFKIRIFTIIRIGMHALVWFIKSKIKNKT